MPGPIPDADTLEAIFGLIPGVVILVGEDRKIRFINRLEVNHELDDVVGQHIAVPVAEEARDTITAIVEHVFETMEPADHPLIEVIGNDGVSFWYEGRMLPIVRDGRVVSVVIVTNNVTDRVVAEQEASMLRSLLPVCAWCHKVQNEEGDWRTIADYLEEKGGDRVTHAICPDCEAEMAGGGTLNSA